MNINIDRLPEYQKAELGRYIQEMEIKTSISFFNNLVDHCVDKCVLTSWGGGFSSKNLTEAEGQCVSRCAEKFLKINQRAGFRFAEFQANQSIAAASQQQK
jgi:import inner membrane translocase subunit TIM9